MQKRKITSTEVKAEALRLGFFACGIARAESVVEAAAKAFKEWLRLGGHAGMGYMDNHTDMRLDPRLLMPEVKSIISVALNYAPAERIPKGQPQLAVYAYGQDYHDVVKQKLHQLASAMGVTSYRAFCDSAPVLERYWAVKAGLGWTGRNHQLIIPHAGSMFFLGELFVDVELDYDTPMTNRCGNCHACIDACPTGAISVSEEGQSLFDANYCLSYQTIENRGDIPHSIAEKMGDMIYGCDRCQEACPWNRFAKPTTEPMLQPKPELLGMTRERWSELTVEEYRALFKGSAVKRAKYEGLMRNIKESLKPDAHPD